MTSEESELLRDYLLKYNRTELLKVLENLDENQSYSIVVNFISLLDENITIANGLLTEPEKYLSAFDYSALLAQKFLLEELKNEKGSREGTTIKTKLSVRVKGVPLFSGNSFPCNNDIGFFVKINGTLIKVGSPKVLEHQRQYLCANCEHVQTVKATYEKLYLIIPPATCPECHSHSINATKEVDVDNFIDYQEAKIQEHFGKSKVGTVPRTMVITLEGTLVDSCKPGDNIMITGTLMRRWKLIRINSRFDIDLVLKANYLEVCNEQKSLATDKDAEESFCKFWNYYKYQELFGRNHILKSFCPQIFGLNLAKLAMATVLAGGVEKTDDSGSCTRGMSHLLLVGDAGTGKSHLLRYASKISSRSVFTTGIGSTTAGLTVAAVRESGDWNLEAGALVLADGGICCIDDFNSIREHDRTSIHEAMEQQSISVAKAGIVTKLNTRCSIFATTSTKGKYDCSVPMSINVAISSPLLSRFDIVLILVDSKSLEWDKSLCSFIFEENKNFKQLENGSKSKSIINDIWSISDFQSYFSIIKKINPTMTAEASLILRTYYQSQRMADCRNAARTTVRLLESLIRLSQGHARLMFREKVTVLDAVTAIILIESSMHNAHLKSEVNALHTRIAKNPYDEYRIQVKLLLNKLQLNQILDDEMKFIEKQEKGVMNKEFEQNEKTTRDYEPQTVESVEHNFRSNNNPFENSSGRLEKSFLNNSEVLIDEILLDSNFNSKNVVQGNNADSDLKSVIPKNSKTYLSQKNIESLKAFKYTPSRRSFTNSTQLNAADNAGFEEKATTSEETNSRKKIKLFHENKDIKESNNVLLDIIQNEKEITSCKNNDVTQKETFKNKLNTTDKATLEFNKSNILTSNQIIPLNSTLESEKPQNLRNIFSSDKDDWDCLDF